MFSFPGEGLGYRITLVLDPNGEWQFIEVVTKLDLLCSPIGNVPTPTQVIVFGYRGHKLVDELGFKVMFWQDPMSGQGCE